MPKTTSYSERARLRLSRDDAFYRRFVAGFERSGLTRSAYCRKHQVGENTFRKYHTPTGSPAAAFRRKRAGMVPSPLLVPLRPVEDARLTTQVIEVRLPDGTLLLLPHFDAVTAEALRALLGRTS